MTVRVLHVGKFFPPDRGGMESFLAELVQAQQAQGLEVSALVHGQPLADDPDWLVRVPVQLRLVYTPIALGFRAALAQAIERFQPDVLHLHMPNVAVFWALTLASARRTSWVVHWHSDVVVSSQSPRALRLAYVAYRPFEQAVLEHADRIVATSQTYLEASEPLAGWHYKCSAVPLGIRTDLALPNEQAQALPWQGDGVRLLSVGRLAHYKGFETLVRAVAASDGVQLVIAGQGEAMAQLQALVAALTPAGQVPRIHLLGEVSEGLKHQLLDSCEAFCLASRERTEAFGVVLLEAMAHAKPCLVTHLQGSGMPWVVQMAGAGLSHIRVDDVQSWVSVLSGLPAQRLQLKEWGAKGREGLEAHFSIDTCAQAIRGEYALGALASRVHDAYRLALPDPLMAPEKSDVLVVIPAKDEAATIAQVVTDVRAAGWRHVLVVDDQSSDETGALAHGAGAQVARAVLPLGAWGGMQLGIRQALAQGFHAVITMDADGQHEVRELPALLTRAGLADVVIGAHPQRVSPLRKLAWRWFKAISGFEFQDLTSGFRYYNRQAMQVLAGSEATLLDYQDVGVLMLLRHAQLRITEVPVHMNTRLSGHSRIFYSWFSVLRYMAVTTLLCLASWNAHPPKPVSQPQRSD
jgi:glycosyltransferase involved in cell wall biosynthesis